MLRKCRGDYAGEPRKRSVVSRRKRRKQSFWMSRLTIICGADERGQYTHGNGKKKNSLGKTEIALGEC